MSFKNVSAYTNTAKPYDISVRPFHRINCPSYDLSVDQRDEAVPAEPLQQADGIARNAGARGPQDFTESGFTQKLAQALVDGLDTLLTIIPGINLIRGAAEAVNEAIKKFADRDLIDEAKKALAKAIGKAFESALFDRYMRVIPAWVPVGRSGYDASSFTYPGPGESRQTDREEEREVEGVLTASYQACNDVPHTQWTRYARWHFHVRPLPGYRKVIGRGNIRISQEEEFIDPPGSQLGTDRYKPVLDIYGQHARQDDSDLGAIECLFDVGAVSLPPADGGSHGVMFDPRWPYWPMTGDHFWAAGRWAYDCARAGKPLGRDDDPDELHPTQIHPCKAIAFSRYEGFKFPENQGGVRAVRFFFMATSEGGYINFRASTDRDGKTHQAPITLRDRPYEFIVDLPERAPIRSPHPIGATTRFMRNTIVVRPRLLMQIRMAPFTGGDKQTPAWTPGLHFHDSILPKVVLLPPDKPGEASKQARVIIPLDKLPAGRPDAAEVYAFDLALGWHDPDGSEAELLQPVTVTFESLTFAEDHAPVRLKTCINGRWKITVRSDVDEKERVPINQQEQFHLPNDARLAISVHGTTRHGFGEYLEGTRLAERHLRVGGIIDIKKDLEEKLQQARTVAERVMIEADLKRIDALLESLGDFIGQRYTPDWLSDIDARRETDDLAEQQRVSAIARELWVRPAPVFNRHDEPIGWVEGVGDDLLPHDVRRARGAIIPEWDRLSSAGRLVRYLKDNAAGQPPDQQTTVMARLIGNRFVPVGAGNNLAQQINLVSGMFGDTEPVEYEATVRVSIPRLP